MNFTVILISFICLTAAGIIEYALHVRRLRSIQMRINVNGTRGKSTVTRLIAAGLREAGISTLAKTTGTSPRIILPDGSEIKMRRRGRARISEHFSVVKRAAQEDARALVVECMALEPENQLIYERMLVKSTIGVMTNIRPDHLDIMGPGLEDVAETLSLTVPLKGSFVMPAGQFEELFRNKCERNGTRFHPISGSEVNEEEVASFGYTSFRENIALALEALRIAGVDRDTALKGMLKAEPDPGVKPIRDIEVFGRKLRIVDAFAANDAVSTNRMWDDFVGPSLKDYDASVVVVNNREDRPQRVGEMSSVAEKLPADRIIFIGRLQALAMRSLKRGMQRASALRSDDPARIIESLARVVPEGRSCIVLLAGNTKGVGGALSEHIETIAGRSAA